VDNRFGKPNLPGASETVAVTLSRPKTGALFFDRIWCSPIVADGPPKEIQVFGATECEILPSIGVLFDSVGKANVWLKLLVRESLNSEPYTKIVSDALYRERGINAVPMYSSKATYNREYLPGNVEALVAISENLAVVDEDKLSWAQVLELRRDLEAKEKLRRMRFWIDSEFSGKTVSHIADACAVRLENYEWALRKHGIETVTGTLSDLLDIKFLPAAAAAGAALATTVGPLVATLGISGLVIGKMALSLTTRFVDLQDRAKGKDSEVAFIHELAKRAKDR
jgi:hypothetical protein